MAAESAIAEMSRNENTLKWKKVWQECMTCQGIFDCTNDAIGVVSRDPYDHVSFDPTALGWSPVVSPRAYCLNCYNERILVALEFIRRGK